MIPCLVSSCVVTSDLTAQNLDKKDLFSQSDPFYCLYRTNTDTEERTLVYRSEWIKVTARSLLEFFSCDVLYYIRYCEYRDV